MVSGPTVQPQRPRFEEPDNEVTVCRPRVGGQSRSDTCVVPGTDQMRCVVARADGAAHHNEPFGYELIHEGGMLVPTVLVTDGSVALPPGAVDQRAQEIRHGRDRRCGY